MTFSGYIRGGHVKLHDKAAFARHATSLEGERIDLVLRKHKEQRSTPQNSRYWALLTVAGRELGYDDPEEIHEGLAHKFLALPPIAGELPRRMSTTSLNTEQFTVYMDQCERYFRIDLRIDLSGWDEEAERLSAA